MLHAEDTRRKRVPEMFPGYENFSNAPQIRESKDPHKMPEMFDHARFPLPEKPYLTCVLCAPWET